MICTIFNCDKKHGNQCCADCDRRTTCKNPCLNNPDKCGQVKNNDMDECRNALVSSFPNSFINSRDEFIAHVPSNQYIILQDCKTPFDVECKVLEWFSRPAHKTQPYSQEWRARKFHEFMLDGINNFLDTHFSMDDIEIIYDKLGNAINHKRTIEFIQRDYDMDWLRGVE